MRLSDKVAYVNHDIEDAVRAEVLKSEGDLPFEAVYVLGRSKSERLTTIIRSVVENSSDDINMAPEVRRRPSNSLRSGLCLSTCTPIRWPKGRRARRRPWSKSVYGVLPDEPGQAAGVLPGR